MSDRLSDETFRAHCANLCHNVDYNRPDYLRTQRAWKFLDTRSVQNFVLPSCSLAMRLYDYITSKMAFQKIKFFYCRIVLKYLKPSINVHCTITYMRWKRDPNVLQRSSMSRVVYRRPQKPTTVPLSGTRSKRQYRSM